jgi:hypothetical protein
MSHPVPTIVLYSKPGCGLCDETRRWLEALLAQRVAGGRPLTRMEERDISVNPAWERAFFASIPVVEAGDRRLKLATSPERLQSFVDEALDGVPSSA